ncbi:MAG: rhomboid family intramembrane serine protease [Caldilineaceae bacterium]
MSSLPPVPEEPTYLPAREPASRPFSSTARPAPDAPWETVDDDAQPTSVASDPRREPMPGLGGSGAANSDANRRLYLELSPPRVSYALIIANLLVFALAIWMGWSRFGILNGYESLDVLVLLGAKVNEYVAVGEWWRLFTAMFLHIGILHLIFNMYAIFAIGPLVEGYYGSVRFAVIYLVGGLFGSLASFAFSPSISAGASGAVFAIAAAAAVYFYRYRENFGARGRAILQNMLIVLGANLVFGMASQGVDNWGHVGGMVGGLITGWALLPRYEAPTVIPAGHSAIAVLPQPAPGRIAVTTVLALIILWLGILAATAHWTCNNWLGC